MKFSWTHPITIISRYECRFANPPVADWLVTLGGSSIDDTALVVQYNAVKSYDVKLAKITIDADLCA